MRLKNIAKKVAPLTATVTFLSGCSDTIGKFEEKPLEEIYNEAMDTFEKGSYNQAAQVFQEVERQHPYSNWASRAQIMAAYSYFQAKKYDEAIENFNVFIQLHPGHEQVAYAYYMLGLCYYEQIPTIERDQKTTAQALDAFGEVVRRFPTSPYGKDSKSKIAFIKDHLAAKEMEVGRYYLRQQSYLAAINRFKSVIENFPTSSHIPEALHRLVECYVALGIKDQAQASAAVLGHNYPGSPWYADTYAIMQKSMPEATIPQAASTQPQKKGPAKKG